MIAVCFVLSNSKRIWLTKWVNKSMEWMCVVVESSLVLCDSVRSTLLNIYTVYSSTTSKVFFSLRILHSKFREKKTLMAKLRQPLIQSICLHAVIHLHKSFALLRFLQRNCDHCSMRSIYHEVLSFIYNIFFLRFEIVCCFFSHCFVMFVHKTSQQVRMIYKVVFERVI